jgi:hypothetical protein
MPGHIAAHRAGSGPGAQEQRSRQKVKERHLGGFKRTGRAMLIALLPFFLMAAAQTPSVPAAGGAVVPEIILQVSDTNVSPVDSTYYVSVYLTNILQEVAGFEITISAGVSGMLCLPDSTRIETTIVCLDTTDCDPADTTIDTLSISPVDLAGTVIENWEFVEARALSPYTFRIAGVADFPGGGNPPPIPTGGPHLLFRMVLEREMPPDILDTLQDRTVPWLIATSVTSFSDPNGSSIGLQESTICIDPPACTMLDTVSYYDPAINIYVDGSVTFDPSCTPGDVNGDGNISTSDIILLINHVFKGGPEPGCNGQAGDADCSGDLSSADIVLLVNFVFKAGPAPCT